MHVVQHLIQTRFAKWKRDAENWYKEDSAMFERLFNSVHTNLVRTRFSSVSHIFTNLPYNIGEGR